MARYRTYTVEFKQQLAEEHLGGRSPGSSQIAASPGLSPNVVLAW
jgi:hypothetical protein